MPAANWFYQVSIGLRRFPLLHSPARWMRRKLWGGLKNLFIEVCRSLSPSNPRLGPPRGTFSIYEGLKATPPRFEGRIVLHGQGMLDVSKDSMLVRCGLNQHCDQPRSILWSRHREARLVGESLALMNEAKQLSSDAVYGPNYQPFDPAYRRLSFPAPVRLPGKWTSVVSGWTPGDGIPTFSHWILDALPRLALLKEFPADVGIIVPKALAGYQKESLKLLGLLDRIRYTPELHLIVEDYYFSSPTTMISCFNPYGVGFLRDSFLPKADPAYSGPKRFIIQRKGKSRGIINEEEFNQFFIKLGWTILDTEKLTLAQEIKLFSEAEAVAGVLGSGFTNAVWSKPGCALFTFIADTWMDGWVEWIASVNHLRYFFEVFPSDHAMMAQIDLGVVQRMLEKADLHEAIEAWKPNSPG